MKWNTRVLSILFVLLLLSCAASAQSPTRTLDIYFIDVEGGAATLIVTPANQSLLVDSGFPGDRDAGRIAHVALEIAGLKQIDHYLTTHWHRDHVGGSTRLAQLIPIKHYYDHGLPARLTADILPELIEAYKQTTLGKSVTLKPGDRIKLLSPKYMPPLQVRVLAAGGIVLGEQPGAAQIQPCGPEFEAKPEDKTDNANSVGILLTF